MIREVLGIPEAFRDFRGPEDPEAWWGPDTLCPSIMTKDPCMLHIYIYANIGGILMVLNVTIYSSTMDPSWVMRKDNQKRTTGLVW